MEDKRNSCATSLKVKLLLYQYRQAPEHFFPIAYEDCWAALQWVASQVIDDTNAVNKEPWSMKHGCVSGLGYGCGCGTRQFLKK